MSTSDYSLEKHCENSLSRCWWDGLVRNMLTAPAQRPKFLDPARTEVRHVSNSSPGEGAQRQRALRSCWPTSLVKIVSSRSVRGHVSERLETIKGGGKCYRLACTCAHMYTQHTNTCMHTRIAFWPPDSVLSNTSLSTPLLISKWA